MIISWASALRYMPIPHIITMKRTSLSHIVLFMISPTVCDQSDPWMSEGNHALYWLLSVLVPMKGQSILVSQIAQDWPSSLCLPGNA